MKNKGRILVTGGAGFIGSHTVVELMARGYETLIVDDLSNSRIESLDGIEKITGQRPAFEKLNICDLPALEKYFSANDGIDAVIHFAAFKAVGDSVANPLKYYHNNLQGMVNVIQCMNKFKVPNIIFSSSATVYGQPDTLPATENSPVLPAESPYGNTKQINEEILRDSVHAYQGLRGIALRYFNPIGAHDSAAIGELPLGVPDNLMPFITQTAAGIREKLRVFGDDYNTVDGSAVRDYIHVVDLARAHVSAVARLLENKNKANYEVFNLGTGKGSSVFEVIQSFEKTTGVKLNYEVVGRRPGDVEAIYADTALANDELGWKAELDLDDMTASAWAWEKAYRNIK